MKVHLLFVGLVAALALSLANVAGGAPAAFHRVNGLDSRLVGSWTRTVTRADVRREEASTTLVGSLCTLAIKKTAAAHIRCPQTPGSDFAGKIIPRGTNRIQVVLGDLSPNTYKWRVNGASLVLTKLRDPTPDRAATMAGTWHRK